ncbi:hypothetical protein PIROE2DRAFT_8297 [Piromyces sp. E2]|nr:hypothetical protein PIROE2DRAFT_8297 [Piromyces sp. E2]|eukprot:OUM64835.1 hypothetical protein PIROE2DRAFT_8297 [Piromyces sp. E2]
MKLIVTLVFMTVIVCLQISEKAVVHAENGNSYFSPFYDTTYPYSIITGYYKYEKAYRPNLSYLYHCAFNSEYLSLKCDIEDSEDKFIISNMEIDNPNNCPYGPIIYASLVNENDNNVYIMNQNNDIYKKFKMDVSDNCTYYVKFGKMNIESYNDLHFPYDSQIMDTDFFLEDDSNITEVDYVHVNSCQYNIGEKQLLCTVDNTSNDNITVIFDTIYLQPNINRCEVNDNSIISVHFYDAKEEEDLTIVGKTSGEMIGVHNDNSTDGN